MSAAERRRRPRVPARLGATGKALWRDLVDDYEFASHELRLLAQACACLDVTGDLEAQVSRDGTMIDGSKGQRVLHPAIAEARQQRMALGRLLAQLRIPDEGGRPSVASATELRARRAAQVRWQGERGYGATA